MEFLFIIFFVILIVSIISIDGALKKLLEHNRELIELLKSKEDQ
ncbi:hypothetical protein [Jeotgalibacillus salarius]|nr:hypothetical protein [Jeotgalibacillus salarius]